MAFKEDVRNPKADNRDKDIEESPDRAGTADHWVNAADDIFG